MFSSSRAGHEECPDEGDPRCHRALLWSWCLERLHGRHPGRHPGPLDGASIADKNKALDEVEAFTWTFPSDGDRAATAGWQRHQPVALRTFVNTKHQHDQQNGFRFIGFWRRGFGFHYFYLVSAAYHLANQTDIKVYSLLVVSTTTRLTICPAARSVAVVTDPISRDVSRVPASQSVPFTFARDTSPFGHLVKGMRFTVELK